MRPRNVVAAGQVVARVREITSQLARNLKLGLLDLVID
jgi:hypothetical protein